MATEYRLTWRDSEKRWRKKYKGKAYYFPALDGKVASYPRCYQEWLDTKLRIDTDNVDSDPHRRAWQTMIDKAGQHLREIAQTDTPENRRAWEFWHGFRELYRDHIDTEFPFASEEQLANPESVQPMLLGGGQFYDERPTPPPWELAEERADPSKTVKGNIDRFLTRKRQQVEGSKLSHGRFDSLRVSLEAFANHVGNKTEIVTVTGQHLSGFRDKLDAQVEQGELSAYSARDRLAACKQFVRWAWAEELMGLPRILDSREFVIRLPDTEIKTFTDEEVGRLLGAAPESTKLYMLLMLNCGMQQQDLAELGQDEVDWQGGTISRKRSKTRKRKADSIPTVTYKLWPETLRLLKTHCSTHPKLVLTNAKGLPIKVETIVDGKVKKTDNVRSSYNRLIMKLSRAKIDPIKVNKPLKLLRKTASSKLGGHKEYSRYAQYFLGHAPTNVADKHYVAPSQEQFDKAVAWLGQQFGQ